MGENIGASARAMLNFGLTDLRLVNPRDGWPNPKAQDTSSGALALMPEVKVFTCLSRAIEDLHTVYATTARTRDMVKPVLSPSQAAEQALCQTQHKSGFVFGAERTGLTNDEVSLCQSIIHIPTNPEFSSCLLRSKCQGGRSPTNTNVTWLQFTLKAAAAPSVGTLP